MRRHRSALPISFRFLVHSSAMGVGVLLSFGTPTWSQEQQALEKLTELLDNKSAKATQQFLRNYDRAQVSWKREASKAKNIRDRNIQKAVDELRSSLEKALARSRSETDRIAIEEIIQQLSEQTDFLGNVISTTQSSTPISSLPRLEASEQAYLAKWREAIAAEDATRMAIMEPIVRSMSLRFFMQADTWPASALHERSQALLELFPDLEQLEAFADHGSFEVMSIPLAQRDRYLASAWLLASPSVDEAIQRLPKAAPLLSDALGRVLHHFINENASVFIDTDARARVRTAVLKLPVEQRQSVRRLFGEALP